jgi:hypothetical protein
MLEIGTRQQRLCGSSNPTPGHSLQPSPSWRGSFQPRLRSQSALGRERNSSIPPTAVRRPRPLVQVQVWLAGKATRLAIASGLTRARSNAGANRHLPPQPLLSPLVPLPGVRIRSRDSDRSARRHTFDQPSLVVDVHVAADHTWNRPQEPRANRCARRWEPASRGASHLGIVARRVL